MRIAQISDTHILEPSPAGSIGAQRAANLRRCVADINRQGVDAVIHTGDSVHEGRPEQYAHLHDILSDLEAPLFLVPGNRDRREALRDAFDHVSELAGDGERINYAVEDFPVRLVAVDTTAPGERKGVFGAERQAWLAEALAQQPDRPTVLFLHHPPFDVPERDYVGGYRNTRDAEDLAALVGRHGQVRRLLCGHVHSLHEVPWAGTTAAIMPSVAVDLRTAPGSETQASYLLHTVSDDGAVASRHCIAAS